MDMPQPVTLIQFDRERRRLWIGGQRCHHGATGALIVAGALAGAAFRALPAPAVALPCLVGSTLMTHDWHDRRVWFKPGRQAMAD